jgi:hypothetical protein
MAFLLDILNSEFLKILNSSQHLKFSILPISNFNSILFKTYRFDFKSKKLIDAQMIRAFIKTRKAFTT